MLAADVSSLCRDAVVQRVVDEPVEVQRAHQVAASAALDDDAQRDGVVPFEPSSGLLLRGPSRPGRPRRNRVHRPGVGARGAPVRRALRRRAPDAAPSRCARARAGSPSPLDAITPSMSTPTVPARSPSQARRVRAMPTTPVRANLRAVSPSCRLPSAPRPAAPSPAMLERLLDASCTLQRRRFRHSSDPPAGALYDPLMHRLATLVPTLALAASAALAQPRADQVDSSALTAAAARLGRVIRAPVATLDRIGVDPFVLRVATAAECPRHRCRVFSRVGQPTRSRAHWPSLRRLSRSCIPSVVVRPLPPRRAAEPIAARGLDPAYRTNVTRWQHFRRHFADVGASRLQKAVASRSRV